MSYKLCKICGEKRANKQHIKTHGISFDDYLKKYEPEKYHEQQAIKAINELYITTRYKHAEMNQYGAYSTYSTFDGIGIKRKYALVDSDIQAHLKHKKTLAVFTPRDYSKFLILDIDERDSVILENVYRAISAYIPAKDIHCSYSGNKGYHVAVFFKELVPKSVLNKFYKIIMDDLGNPHKIELLGADDKPVKLPLGINFKNKDNYDNFCYFCDEHGNDCGPDILDSWQYIQSIKPIDPEPIYTAVKSNYSEKIGRLSHFSDDELIEIDELRELATKAHFVNYSLSNKIDTIEKAIELGMNEPGTRHKTMLNIAIYLKDIKGCDIEETRSFLRDWISKQDTELYKSNSWEIEKDIKHMTKSVYTNDYKLKTNKREVTLTALDLKEILSVKGKALRRLYFILYIHGKAYCDNTGAFYMTYKQIGQAGNKSRRQHIKKQIRRLEQLGKVEIMQQDQYKKPNKYRIPALSQEVSLTVGIEEFNICDLNCDNCLEKACSYLLTPEEIKEFFDRRNIKEVTNLKGKCKNPKNKK